MIDFNVTIKDLDGNSFKDDSKEVTLKQLVVTALSAQFQDEQNLTADKKFKRGSLAYDIHKSTEPMKLKSEDITTIKEVVGKAYSPLFVFCIYPLLDEGEK